LCNGPTPKKAKADDGLAAIASRMEYEKENGEYSDSVAAFIGQHSENPDLLRCVSLAVRTFTRVDGISRDDLLAWDLRRLCQGFASGGLELNPEHPVFSEESLDKIDRSLAYFKSTLESSDDSASRVAADEAGRELIRWASILARGIDDALPET